MNPLPLVGAMLRRNAGTCIAFVVLIALAVGLAAAITAQERALRHGTAHAADKFDLLVAAPGSQTDILLKVVFLQPGSVELIEGDPLRRLMSESRAEFVAPIGFGDSYGDDPVVGSIPALVDHLAGGALEGRVFARIDEAVVGSQSPLAVGETFRVTHGHGAEAMLGDEHGQALTVVGRLPPTGSPWDRAVVVPIEFVWNVHGLGVGHGAIAAAAGPVDADHDHEAGEHDHAHDAAAGQDEHAAEGDDHDHDDHEHGPSVDYDGPVGPPFDLESLPGIPAAVIKPVSLQDAYGLRNAWRTTETMAFFPAEVLVELYDLLGDVRAVMSALAVATEVLLIAAVLAGLLVLMRLYRHRFAVLRALGASRGYIFAVAWCFGFALILAGSVVGLGVAAGLTGLVSRLLEAESGVALTGSLGLPELALAAAVSAIGALLATAPAILLYREPVVATLRGGTSV